MTDKYHSTSQIFSTVLNLFNTSINKTGQRERLTLRLSGVWQRKILKGLPLLFIGDIL